MGEYEDYVFPEIRFNIEEMVRKENLHSMNDEKKVNAIMKAVDKALRMTGVDWKIEDKEERDYYDDGF